MNPYRKEQIREMALGVGILVAALLAGGAISGAVVWAAMVFARAIT